MKTFFIIVGIILFIMMLIRFDGDYPMGHHEIDCDIDN